MPTNAGTRIRRLREDDLKALIAKHPDWLDKTPGERAALSVDFANAKTRQEGAAEGTARGNRLGMTVDKYYTPKIKPLRQYGWDNTTGRTLGQAPTQPIVQRPPVTAAPAAAPAAPLPTLDELAKRGGWTPEQGAFESAVGKELDLTRPGGPRPPPAAPPAPQVGTPPPTPALTTSGRTPITPFQPDVRPMEGAAPRVVTPEMRADGDRALNAATQPPIQGPPLPKPASQDQENAKQYGMRYNEAIKGMRAATPQEYQETLAARPVTTTGPDVRASLVPGATTPAPVTSAVERMRIRPRPPASVTTPTIGGMVPSYTTTAAGTGTYIPGHPVYGAGQGQQQRGAGGAVYAPVGGGGLSPRAQESLRYQRTLTSATATYEQKNKAARAALDLLTERPFTNAAREKVRQQALRAMDKARQGDPNAPDYLTIRDTLGEELTLGKDEADKQREYERAETGRKESEVKAEVARKEAEKKAQDLKTFAVTTADKALTRATAKLDHLEHTAAAMNPEHPEYKERQKQFDEAIEAQKRVVEQKQTEYERAVHEYKGAPSAESAPPAAQPQTATTEQQQPAKSRSLWDDVRAAAAYAATGQLPSAAPGAPTVGGGVPAAPVVPAASVPVSIMTGDELTRERERLARELGVQ